MKRKKFITTCKEFYLLIFITFLIFLLIIFSISWIMFANKYPKYIVSMGNFKRTRTLGNNYDTYIKEDDDSQTELDYPHYLNFVCILKCSSKKNFFIGDDKSESYNISMEIKFDNFNETTYNVQIEQIKDDSSLINYYSVTDNLTLEDESVLSDDDIKLYDKCYGEISVFFEKLSNNYKDII